MTLREREMVGGREGRREGGRAREREEGRERERRETEGVRDGGNRDASQ